MAVGFSRAGLITACENLASPKANRFLPTFRLPALARDLCRASARFLISAAMSRGCHATRRLNPVCRVTASKMHSARARCLKASNQCSTWPGKCHKVPTPFPVLTVASPQLLWRKVLQARVPLPHDAGHVPGQALHLRPGDVRALGGGEGPPGARWQVQAAPGF